MKSLRVSVETGSVLKSEYGYTDDNFLTPKGDAYLAYPKAKLLLRTDSTCLPAGYEPEFLEVDDILSLELLDTDAWDAYLSSSTTQLSTE